VPQALFIIRWADLLEDKWVKRELFEKQLTMTTEERARLKQVRRGGDVQESVKPAAESKKPVRKIVRRVVSKTPSKPKLSLPKLSGDGFFGKYEE
jgi:uncharacterized protein YajQ (UPF0234 family)